MPRSPQSRECRSMSDARENGDRDKAQPMKPLSPRDSSGSTKGLARDHAGRPSDGPGEDRATTASGYARGFRLSSELVAGVLVGAGLGWLIDRLLGISPWGLIVFLLLGFAAGVLNVMRSAGVVPRAPRLMTARRDREIMTRRIGASERHGTCRSIRSISSRSRICCRSWPPWAVISFVHQFGAVHVHHRRRRFALLIGATAPRAVVPGRLQSIAEMSYEFVANTVRSSAGTEGMKFFPFVFTLFMFVLFANMIGLIPYSFTVTSQLIVTAALALLVFFIVVDLRLLEERPALPQSVRAQKGVPKSHPAADRVHRSAVVLSRPVSHSVRLFANMLAGHITLQVFAGFIIMLAGFGVLGWFGAVLPFIMVIMLTALELLVAFLQAYVFAILTCIYLNDAIHPGH
jgi:F-type H+-transporting ATPase subunit a